MSLTLTRPVSASEDRPSVSEVCRSAPVLRPSGPGVTRAQKDDYRARRRAANEQREACVRRERERRDDPKFAARSQRRLSLVLGYDGAMWGRTTEQHEQGRYRAPSVLVGAAFRRHYLRRFGVHAVLGGTLGPGRIGAGNFETTGIEAQRVGPGWGAIAEAGLVMGPTVSSAAIYFVLASQFRIAVPGATEATLTLGSNRRATPVTVRWQRPIVGLGFRAGPGILFGAQHQAYFEAGFGGGAMLGSVRGDFITVGVRAGYTLGR